MSQVLVGVTKKRKLSFRIVVTISFFLIVLFLFLLFFKNESGKLDLLSGIAQPGDRWEQKLPSGHLEVLEFISGESWHPLRGPRNGFIKNRAVDPQGKLIYDIEYHFDSLGRRVTPNTKKKQNSSQEFAVFFGCSDLLGVGVNGQDTIPAIFSAEISKYHSYNYGFPGTGAHYVYRLIEAMNLKAELAEPKGLFIYVVTEGHYPKTLIKPWHIIRPVMPSYKIIDGQLIYKGTIFEANPILTLFKKYLGTSWWRLQFENANKLTSYSSEDHDFVCGTLKAIQGKLQSDFPDSKFLLLLHENLPELDRKFLKTCAQKEKIEFVNSQFPYDSEKFDSDQIYFHPTRALNEAVTHELISHLKSSFHE